MSKRAEEKAVEYQIKTHGPNVMGGASVLSEDEYMCLNMNYDFKAGYEQAEKDLGWISVKDRLPDTTDYMFTCIEMNGIPQCVGFHYYKDGKWFEGFEEDTVGAVEYWMPMPKLPEEEEK